MNERNVEALVGLVLAMAREFGTTLYDLEGDTVAACEVALWLADRGVLVPSAIADEEADQWANPDDFRQALARIAKGAA